MALVVDPPLSWDQIAQIVGTRNVSMCNSRASRRHIREALPELALLPRRPPKNAPPQVLPADDTFLLDFDIDAVGAAESERAMKVLTDHEMLQEFDRHDAAKRLEADERIDDEIRVEASKTRGSFNVRIAGGPSPIGLADGPVLRAAVSLTLGHLGGPGLSFTYADWKRGGAKPGAARQAVLAGKITDFWARRKVGKAPKPSAAEPALVLKKGADPLPVPNYSAADRPTAAVMQERSTIPVA